MTLAKPVPFIIRSVRPNNGIRQIHLSLDQGQPNEVWFNITSDVMAEIFGNEVCEGDRRVLSAVLLGRAGTNGMKPTGP
jgi:hypothetical protein